jgi:hypothetical protein
MRPVTVIAAALTAIEISFSTAAPEPTIVRLLDFPGNVPAATLSVATPELTLAGTGLGTNVAVNPVGRFGALSITSPMLPTRSIPIVTVAEPAIGTSTSFGIAVSEKSPLSLPSSPTCAGSGKPHPIDQTVQRAIVTATGNTNPGVQRAPRVSRPCTMMERSSAA